MPCADLGLDYYRDTLIELEELISDSSTYSPVVITGDFNAHLDQMWGPCGFNATNPQGLMVGDLLMGCDLYAASLSGCASGPNYTFHSGGNFSTVDYIFTDVEASSGIEKCWTHEEHPLNLSDHLPVTVILSGGGAMQQTQDSDHGIKIDWTKADMNGVCSMFQEAMRDRLSPFIGKFQSDVNQLNDEIQHVSSLIINAAETFLPHCKTIKTSRFRTILCHNFASRANLLGRNGMIAVDPMRVLFMKKSVVLEMKLESVLRCVRQWKRGNEYNIANIYSRNKTARFMLPQKRKKPYCSRLRVNGHLISDSAELLEAWSAHFESLAQSVIDKVPALQNLHDNLASLVSESFQKEEQFLDIPFSVEEVEHILHHNMKLRKAPGPDNLMTEHLHYGGPSVILWLTEILNCIVELEEIPSILKHGTTIPVYKGGG